MSYYQYPHSFNTTNPYQNFPLQNNSYNSSLIDHCGNITLPLNYVQPSRSSPPPSPPWGQRTVSRNVTMNVSYKLQPIGVIPATGHFLNKSHVGNVLLCSLIPVLGQQRDLARHQRIKLHRVKAIRGRKRSLHGRSLLFSNLKQRKLKRLQRKPLLKAKKQEVFEKWEKKKLRQEFKRRRERSMGWNDSSIFSSTFMDGMTSFREASQSPFQCPLWSCKRRRRRSRREEFEENKRLRKSQSSRLSCFSDKSRSPIAIRSSPLLFNSTL